MESPFKLLKLFSFNLQKNKKVIASVISNDVVLYPTMLFPDVVQFSDKVRLTRCFDSLAQNYI